MKTRHLIMLMAILAMAVAEYAVFSRVNITKVLAGPPAGAQASASASASPSPAPPYDVTPLLKPANKYLGVAIDTAPRNMKPLDDFTDRIGKRPNLVAIYESWADAFTAAEVRKVYEYGGLAVIRWEPFKAKLADIAAGRHDAYITTFATAVHQLNLPIVITFAHEMNGNWYSWGRANKRSDFIAAWRHIHDVFARVRATNVIWTWTPNVINPMRGVRLKPFYPGDAYVDWVGVDGYYTVKGQKSFKTLFGPTLEEIRGITRKPVLIVETAAEPGAQRPGQIKNLFTEIAARPDLLGLIWFNNNGSGRWNIDHDAASVSAFRKQAGNTRFGFSIPG